MSLWAEIAAGVGWAVAVAGVGGTLTRLDGWYDNLKRPRLQPPDWAFGPAWTVILALAATAAVLAWRASTEETRGLVLWLMAANAVLNIFWNVLFFTWKRPDWALIEVGLLWASILIPIVLFWPASPAASLCLVPYLLWVSFASYLNYGIVRLNAPFGSAAEAERKVDRVRDA